MPPSYYPNLNQVTASYSDLAIVVFLIFPPYQIIAVTTWAVLTSSSNSEVNPPTVKTTNYQFL